MSYTVLARKYRPQVFSDLVGQDHVARTLGRAIETDRVAHAFLFTGVRGVGKTTSARLLAKALNCVKGPTPEPCNACDPCKDITAGRDMDVLEIDGASNNSVDDVRKLQETLPFPPTRDRYRVVIVDEVHMLSGGAFNAFLKTLEEPPDHIKFIFATTESHKVPITIRSRCQRHDFRLIPAATMAKRIREILAIENIEADDDAVLTIAREAQGSLRDALTLLDQAIAFSEGTLVGAEVCTALGVASSERVYATVEAILAGDMDTLTRHNRDRAEHGVDPFQFAQQLLTVARDLVLVRVSNNEAASLTGLSTDQLSRLQKMGEKSTPLELQRLFSGFNQLAEEVGRARLAHVSLDMGLIRMATRPRLLDMASLLARLEQLERRLGSNPSAPTEPQPPGASQPPGKPQAPRSSKAQPSTPQVSSTPKSAAAPEVSSGAETTAAPEVAPAPEVAAAPETPSSRVPSAVLDGSEPHDLWEQVVQQVRQQRPALGAILEHGVPRHVTPERVVVEFEETSFFGRQAQDKDSVEAIQEAASSLLASSLLGSTPEVKVELVKELAARQGNTLAQQAAQRREQRLQEVEQQARTHPVVNDALEVFSSGQEQLRVSVEQGALDGSK